MINNNNEYIICAAIYLEMDDSFPHQPVNITNGLVVCGRRHHNCFTIISNLDNSFNIVKNKKQGFITSKDRFVDRQEAAEIALKSGQTKKITSTLMSEDLY